MQIHSNLFPICVRILSWDTVTNKAHKTLEQIVRNFGTGSVLYPDTRDCPLEGLLLNVQRVQDAKMHRGLTDSHDVVHGV